MTAAPGIAPERREEGKKEGRKSGGMRKWRRIACCRADINSGLVLCFYSPAKPLAGGKEGARGYNLVFHMQPKTENTRPLLMSGVMHIKQQHPWAFLCWFYKRDSCALSCFVPISTQLKSIVGIWLQKHSLCFIRIGISQPAPSSAFLPDQSLSYEDQRSRNSILSIIVKFLLLSSSDERLCFLLEGQTTLLTASASRQCKQFITIINCPFASWR